MRLHRRPLAGNDAVDAGVAKRSVARYLMAAQNAVELGAQSFDAAAALMVEKMRSELDRDAAQRVKGMTKKQKLALRIELRPLHAFPVPGPANLQAAMIRLDVQIIRHPRGLAGGTVENHKRKARALRLRGQPLLYKVGHLVGRRNGGVPQSP